MSVSERPSTLGRADWRTRSQFPAPSTKTRHQSVLSRLFRRKVGVIGGLVVTLIALAAVGAPYLSPQDPFRQRLEFRFAGIGQEGYLLGADALGRDILSRLLWGGRISLVTGVAAAVIALGVGVPVGVLAGYRGGWFDSVVMRSVDMLLAFPYILLAIVIVATFGPGLRNTIIAVAVTNIPWVVRVMRGIVLTVRHLQYVEAAEALGASESRILRKTILPALLPYTILSLVMSVGWLILEGAGLSFLGLGAQAPAPEWGAMLAESRQYLAIAPHTVLIPGSMLLIIAVALNLFGDALGDALDVRLRD